MAIKIKTGRGWAGVYHGKPSAWTSDSKISVGHAKGYRVRIVTESDWRKIQRVVRAAEVFVTGYENGRMAFRKDSEAALVKSVAALRGEKHGK